MNIKEIKEMISLMNENGLVELEIEKDGLKLRLKKTNGGIQQELIAPPRPQQTPQGIVAHPLEIKSPMVGTFYRAPAPDAAPYVQEGQDIDVGQVVCIVEAMKLMNEIKSEVKGRITKILVENADPIEYGQTLFLVEAAK